MKLPDNISRQTVYAIIDEWVIGERAERDGYSGEGRSYRGRSYGNGRSYARRRDAMGRYSRGMGDYSGTYPMDYIDPYWDRRF